MKDALAIHRWLLAHQVHHEIVRLPHPLTCADDLPETLRVPPGMCVGVTVFDVTSHTGRNPVAVVGPVSSPPSPGVICLLLSAQRVRTASAFAINAATDYAAGLVCPLLLPDDLPVLVDERIGQVPEVHTPTGERRTALSLSSTDLLALVPGKSVDLTPAPGPATTLPVAH